MKKTKEQTNKDESLVRFAAGLISFAKQGKKSSGVIPRYKKSIDYYNGVQEKSFENKKMQRVWNKYAEIFENRIASIVSKRPKWRYRPQGEHAILNSDIANQILSDVLWDKIEWEDKGEDGLLDAAHAGSGHIKTVLSDGDKGLPDFAVVPADCVDQDPKGKSLEQCRFLIHYIDMPVSKIKKKYKVNVAPDAVLEKIQAEGTFENPEISFEAQGDSKMENVWDKTGLSSLNTSDIAKDVLGTARIAEVFHDDYTLEMIPYDPAETEEEHKSFNQSIQRGVGKNENHIEFHRSLSFFSVAYSLSTLFMRTPLCIRSIAFCASSPSISTFKV